MKIHVVMKFHELFCCLDSLNTGKKTQHSISSCQSIILPIQINTNFARIYCGSKKYYYGQAFF